jgi:hypothetical protein
MHRKRLRQRKGHSIAELGPALFMILLIMVLPVACLASLGIRYTLMFYAARQACREGAVSSYGPNTPVPGAVVINTRNNVYNYRVRVDAEVRPLFEAAGNGAGWFSGAAGVPGLTKPFPVRITCAAMCEKPEGLKQ